MHSFCYVVSIACGLDWIFRFQTLLVGAFAVSIALRQSGISRRQIAIMETQQKAAKATASLTVNRLLEQADRFTHGLVASPARNSDALRADVPGLGRWNNHVVFHLIDDIEGVDAATFQEAAVKAFPDQANDLVLLATAVNDLKTLRKQYDAHPWLTDPVSAKVAGLSAEDIKQQTSADDAIERISARFAAVRDALL